MGHIRLGLIPKTQAWADVLESFGMSAHSELTGPSNAAAGVAFDTPLIASKTLQAASEGMSRAMNDQGVGFTFYLLSQTLLASRSDKWAEELAGLGVNIGPEDDLFSLRMALQERVDEYLRSVNGRTDIGEMSQKALGEALGLTAGASTRSLFGEGGEELRFALRKYSTKAGFGEITQQFFGRFLNHFLSFYLSRVSPSATASAEDPIGALREFNRELSLHSHESAAIIRDFAAEWYSKTVFEGGITQENVSRFLAVAIRKLRDELVQQDAG